MSESLTVEQYQNKLDLLEEQMQALQGMLEMTTTHLIAYEKEIKDKNVELEVLNKELKDGLSYGKYVQAGLYPSNEKLGASFLDSFIYLQQRDSVGGDLPYCNKIGDMLFIGVIDCTGHGVAGAILTGLANSFLNDLLPRYGHDLLKVAEELNFKFFQIFGEKGPSFGMELGLIMVNQKESIIKFLGCGRPLLLMRANEVMRYRKSGPGIGTSPNSAYLIETINYQQDDSFYLYSDGITDQLGDEVPKRITERRISELLIENSALEMNEQAELIESFICKWAGNMAQTDDQLMIGIKIK